MGNTWVYDCLEGGLGYLAGDESTLKSSETATRNSWSKADPPTSCDGWGHPGYSDIMSVASSGGRVVVSISGTRARGEFVQLVRGARDCGVGQERCAG